MIHISHNMQVGTFLASVLLFGFTLYFGYWMVVKGKNTKKQKFEDYYKGRL